MVPDPDVVNERRLVALVVRVPADDGEILDEAVILMVTRELTVEVLDTLPETL